MTLKERADRHDRENAAIRKLILAGMKVMNCNAEQLHDLAAAQRVTERSLQALMDTLRRGGNGHTGRGIGIR